MQNLDNERRKGFLDGTADGLVDAVHIRHDVVILESYYVDLKENIDAAFRFAGLPRAKKDFDKAVDQAAKKFTKALWIPELHNFIGSNGAKGHPHHEIRHECVERKNHFLCISWTL